jgi:hypothetical protein
MFSPTIREDLSRLRRSELTRRAERHRRLAPVPRARSARRVISALLAIIQRHATLPASSRSRRGVARGDRPFVSLRESVANDTRPDRPLRAPKSGAAIALRSSSRGFSHFGGPLGAVSTLEMKPSWNRPLAMRTSDTVGRAARAVQAHRT